jgi:ketopantoate reductase
MTHQVSPLGIVGLGALGRAVETFLIPEKNKTPSAILFAVKAFDLDSALRGEASKWPLEIPFVTLSNGYVSPLLENLLPVLHPRPIHVGMTTIGSTIGVDGSLTVFSNHSVTAWGPIGPKCPPPTPEEMARLRLFPNGQWHNDMRPLLRQKWLYNVVINSLCAVYRLPSNGMLIAHRTEAEDVLAEALELAHLLWKDVPWDSAKDNPQELIERLWSVITATSGNENSMVRDLRLKKQTESLYLAGVAQNYDGFAKLKKLHHQIITR